jgi:hypothetical protein
MRLVQLKNRGNRFVAIVDGNSLRLLDGCSSVYELARAAIHEKKSLTELAQRSAGETSIAYDDVYNGRGEWRLLIPFDHPSHPAQVLVSGTGLTHKASADNRAAMHGPENQNLTDSMRMYRMGKEGGRPAPGKIGVQPEWFYKGDGGILKANMEPLVTPAYGNDGGEEPEIVGAYLIAEDGNPYRVGFSMGNEFSDHEMEQKNYLYLAPSKLRNCSVGPELILGGAEVFEDLNGTVEILRGESVVWRKSIFSGEVNMCHSLENLEHHHFKYEAHRRPGDVHIHFFGADAFSFGEKVLLEEGDIMEINFPAFGKPLRNPIQYAREDQSLVRVHSLA